MIFEKWDSLELVSIDLEGTGGQDKENEAILEIAVIKITHGKVDERNPFHSLINPGRKFPKYPWLSLTYEDVEDAPPFEDIRSSLVEFLSSAPIMLAHNAHTDYKLLRRRCPEYRPYAVLDTLKLARRAFPTEHTYKLDQLIQRFDLDQDIQVTPNFKPHRALYDALMTARLFVYIMNSHLKRMTIGELINVCGLRINTGTQGSLF